MLQYFACGKPLRFVNSSTLQFNLCNFGLRILVLADPPSHYKGYTINNFTLHSRSLHELPLCPLRDFLSRRTLQRSLDHLCSHKATEMSIYAAGTALSGSTSVVITTPTKIYSHKSICLIIAIFICDTVKHSQSSQKLVTHKYCSITVLTDL